MSQSLAKAMRILKCLGGHPHGLGVRELGRQVRMNPSTVHALLKTMQKERFVAFDEGMRRYELGLAIADLAPAVDRGACLRIATEPEVEAVFAAVGESTTAVGWIDGRAVVLCKHQSDHQLVTAMPDGVVRQPHLWASGLCLLAHQSEAVLRAYIAAQAEQDKALSEKGLRAELDAVRAAGHAEAVDVRGSGVAALAVPVPDPRGEVRLAIALSAPLSRFPAERRRAALAELRRSAVRLSAVLGADA